MKKGFTLVELLAVIMILGIITVIAIPCYLSINKNINKGIYEAKVAEIMSSGSKYAETTGVLAFNVKDLINDGYLKADNETGEYYDNFNNRSMVCDIVTINIDSNGNYNSNIITHDGTCLSKTEINDLYGLIKINIDYYDKDDSKLSNPNKVNGWVKARKAILSYSVNTSILEGFTVSNISNLLWSGGTSENVCSTSNLDECKTYTLSTTNTLSTEVTLSVDLGITTDSISEVDSSFNNTIININATVDVNLDNEIPSLYEDSLYVSEGYTSSSRRLSFEVSDGVGSGVSYYAFYNNSSFTGTPIYTNDNASNGVNDASFSMGGTYYLLIRDRVGNELKYDKPINVTEVDKTKPVIKLSNYDGGWTNNKVTVNWSLEEGNASNIQSYYYTLGGSSEDRLDSSTTSMSFDEEMDKIFTIFAVDKSGNASNKASIAIRIDRTPPTLSFSINPTNSDGTNSWYKNQPTLSYTYNDAKSGINKLMRCSGTSVSACGTESAIASNSIKLNSNANAQTICMKAYDKVGNSKVYCSPSYKVDLVNPIVNSVTLSHTNGSLKVTATATEVHSGIAKVEMKLDNGSYVNNGTSLTKTFTGVNMYSNHTVYVRITDKAGRVSTEVSKTISTVTVRFDPNAGSGGVTKQVLPGTTYSNFFPGNPSRTHYTFNGWYNGSTKATTSMSVLTAVTYKASWTINSYGININMLDPDGNEPYSTCGVGRMSISYDGGNTWSNNVCNESRSTLPYGTVIKVKNISINSDYKLTSVNGRNEGNGVYSITVGDNAANNVINVRTESNNKLMLYDSTTGVNKLNGVWFGFGRYHACNTSPSSGNVNWTSSGIELIPTGTGETESCSEDSRPNYWYGVRTGELDAPPAGFDSLVIEYSGNYQVENYHGYESRNINFDLVYEDWDNRKQIGFETSYWSIGNRVDGPSVTGYSVVWIENIYKKNSYSTGEYKDIADSYPKKTGTLSRDHWVSKGYLTINFPVGRRGGGDWAWDTTGTLAIKKIYWYDHK